MRGSVDDPQRTVRPRGEVVDLNQQGHAAGVQIRHRREIQFYSSNTSTREGVHRPLQITAEWNSERSADVQDRDARRTFLSHTSHGARSLNGLDARMSKPDSTVNTLHSESIPSDRVTCRCQH